MNRRLLLYFVLFLILFSTLDSGTDGSLYPFAVLSLASALLLILHAFSPSPELPPARGEVVALLLFLAWCAVSLAYTIDRPSTEYGLIRVVAAAVLVVVVPAAFPRSERQEVFWKTAVLWAGVLSLAGLAQTLFALGQYGSRAHSLFVTPNTFAGYLLIPLPAAFALRLQARTPGERRLWGACGLLTGAAFAATGSRGAWLALLGAGVLWTAALIFSGRLPAKTLTTVILRQRRVLGAVLVICAATLAFQAYRDPGMTERFLSLSRPFTAEPDRYRYWASTLEIVRTRPWLGYGLGTFRFVYVGHQSRDLGGTAQYYAHNDYLQMAAESGLVGLGLYLLLSTMVAALGWRALRRGKGPLATALALGLWGVQLHSLVDFDFHIPAIQTLFWLGVAFLLTAGDAAVHGTEAPTASRGPRWLVRGAAILLLLYVGGTVARNFLAERASAQGFALVQRRELAGARRRFTAAASLVPYSSHHLGGLAGVALLEGESRKNPRLLGESASLLQRALALNPYDYDTRILLARLYSRNLDLLGDEARPRLVAVLEEGLTRLPNADVFRRQLGRVLLESGETARAVALLERYLDWWPGDTAARLLLAEGYSRSGRPDESGAQARAVLALDPENAQARTFLSPAVQPKRVAE